VENVTSPDSPCAALAGRRSRPLSKVVSPRGVLWCTRTAPRLFPVPSSGLLSLRGVCVSFRRGRDRGHLPVLVDVSLELSQGEIVAVVGSRAEGKTTLLEVAAGIRPPDRGQVWLGGLELSALCEEERAGLLGRDIRWVRRGGTGLSLDVLDYVGLPLAVGRGRPGGEATRLALGALERVGAAGCAGLRWEDLSNWERVLVAFARGIVGSPQLLVVDDVLDGLGMRRTREAGELLCSLVAELGCGVLMSASDLEATLFADRVLYFEHGGLVAMSGQDPREAEVIPLRRTARSDG
jgi:predicted ABC-type transport system involved in lysophospholipase L1 biosynthesis ATPase subunit